MKIGSRSTRVCRVVSVVMLTIYPRLGEVSMELQRPQGGESDLGYDLQTKERSRKGQSTDPGSLEICPLLERFRFKHRIMPARLRNDKVRAIKIIRIWFNEKPLICHDERRCR